MNFKIELEENNNAITDMHPNVNENVTYDIRPSITSSFYNTTVSHETLNGRSHVAHEGRKGAGWHFVDPKILDNPIDKDLNASTILKLPTTPTGRGSKLGLYTPSKAVSPNSPLKTEGPSTLADSIKLEIDKLKDDPIKPNHYGGTVILDFIEGLKISFALGNCIKYISRAGKKAGNSELQDLKKAQFYLNYHIEQLENK